jgi:hypothetical protein
MKAEHCSKVGYNLQFTTSNYKITTTPKQEWMITVDGIACPVENMAHGRVLRELRECTCLPLVLQSKLTTEELIAVILYTGPMVFFAHESSSQVM